MIVGKDLRMFFLFGFLCYEYRFYVCIDIMVFGCCGFLIWVFVVLEVFLGCCEGFLVGGGMDVVVVVVVSFVVVVVVVVMWEFF